MQDEEVSGQVEPQKTEETLNPDAQLAKEAAEILNAETKKQAYLEEVRDNL